MTNDDQKVETTISEKRVKLHLFEPSNRTIWTVVGKEKEYWLDPDMEYCSCPAFYFSKLDSAKRCYHLDSQKLADEENKVEVIKFSDDEYSDFMFGLISDL